MRPKALMGVYPPAPSPRALATGGLRAFPFDEPNFALTHLGRGAVWLAMEALGIGPGKRVAMPAYHCGSEVEAAHLAGAEIDFYRVNADLTVDREDLARAVERSDVTYLISHFGFPVVEAPDTGGPVIVDAAHALYSCDGDEPIGKGAAATIFCPRKTLGVPDGGGLLLADRPAAARERRPNAKAMARSGAALVANRAALSRFGTVREGTITETVIGEWGLEREDMEAAAAQPSRVTAALAPRADAETIRARRRSNYRLLLDGFAALAPPPYRELPDGVCPLYFPVQVADRPRAVARLLELGVRAIEVWPVPHPLLDRERFSELEPARAGLIGVPVHQELEPWHMELVAGALEAAIS
jgi:perosamine synthetase